MTIGYLVSEYPARSHTFIRRELAAVRKQGIAIEVFAIRRPDQASLISNDERQDYETTWSILPTSLKALLITHGSLFWANPKAYLKTLWRSQCHRNPGLKNSLWGLFHFIEAIQLAKQLQARNIQHLHVHFANAGASIGLLCHSYSGITWSMTLHGACDFEFPAGPLLAEKLRSVTFANCASYYGRSQALRVLEPNDWSKIFVPRCGIPYDLLPPPLEETQNTHTGGQSAPLKVYCVGRISSEKGHLGLLEALRISHQQGLVIDLYLIGDGPDRQRLEQRIAELQLGQHVHLLGAKSEFEVLDEVRHADMFALPSFMEGIPLVLMEAMGLNIPVVAPRIAGIPELVEDGTTGLLFHPADWNDMAACFIKLASDPALQTHLRTHAQHKVAKEFDITVAVQPLVDAFKRLGR